MLKLLLLVLAFAIASLADNPVYYGGNTISLTFPVVPCSSWDLYFKPDGDDALVAYSSATCNTGTTIDLVELADGDYYVMINDGATVQPSDINSFSFTANGDAAYEIPSVEVTFDKPSDVDAVLTLFSNEDKSAIATYTFDDGSEDPTFSVLPASYEKWAVSWAGLKSTGGSFTATEGYTLEAGWITFPITGVTDMVETEVTLVSLDTNTVIGTRSVTGTDSFASVSFSVLAGNAFQVTAKQGTSTTPVVRVSPSISCLSSSDTCAHTFVSDTITVNTTGMPLALGLTLVDGDELV
ncbi:hypothetical protein KIPB_012551, partial [Kipferlia bialata]|eukprot:g12551.t1